MAKLKRLIESSESNVEVESPVTDAELKKREADYPILSFIDFAKRHRSYMYTPVKIRIDNVKHDVQANFCVNPYCRWYGLPQHRYNDLKFKPYRYTLWGTHPTNSILCKHVPTDEPKGLTMDNDYTQPMSNWSLALEIKRLKDIDTLKPMKSQYRFHKDDCVLFDTNPFEHPSSFYKRGKSSSNSQKYQCKSCGKMTNVLPSNRESFTYNQQRNDVLVQFFLQIVSRVPVTSTLKILGIGASTYYNKLEWIYRRCLEFTERNETKKLKDIEFNTLWLNTDKFIYYLNNVRKKGHANGYNEQERLQMPTHIVATVDAYSRFVFRADIAYDFNITSDEIEEDIEKYKEDKLQTFVQKNARYRYSYYGNRKFKKEDFIDDVADDIFDDSYLSLRKDYVDGLHVNSSYTAYAQYWHIKKLLNVKKLNIVCDEDRTLLNAMLRVFSDEVKEKRTHIYVCQVEKSLSKKEAYREYLMRKEELDGFQESLGNVNRRTAATIMLATDLENYNLFNIVIKNGEEFAIPIDGAPLQHPMPYKDEGIRYIKPITNLLGMTNYEIAKEIINVDMRAINTFFNQLRRKNSIFERPLVTARGDGKSYIYANFNPRYAHYMLTITRTYLNFCETYKYKGKDVTPAMRLGIADRPCTVQEILYMK